MMKHIRLYEYDGLQSQLEVLAELHSSGLISIAEYNQMKFEIAPETFEHYEISLTIDWELSEDYDPDEILADFEDSLIDDPPPTGSFVRPGSIDIDDWDPGESRHQFKHSLRFILTVDLTKLTRLQLRSWLTSHNSSLFDDVDIEKITLRSRR